MRHFVVEYDSKILCAKCGHKVRIRASGGAGWSHCHACGWESPERFIKTFYCGECRKNTPHGENENPPFRGYWTCLKCGVLSRKSGRGGLN